MQQIFFIIIIAHLFELIINGHHKISPLKVKYQHITDQLRDIFVLPLSLIKEIKLYTFSVHSYIFLLCAMSLVNLS